MANERQNILELARKDGLAVPSAGLSVPDGYFDSFADKMAAMLPERPELEHPDEINTEGKRPLWNIVRPYVYMAAMFAGVWLMLQMFTMMTGANRLQPMDSNPVLAEALMNDDFMDNYIYNDVDDWELVDQMIEDGSLNTDEPFDFEDFTAITPDSETEPTDVILPQ